MHSNELDHVSPDTSTSDVSLSFFQNLLGPQEIAVWEALVDLGSRTSIREIAFHVDRSPRTTRARVNEIHKKGIFEYGAATTKRVGGQGIRSYVLRCIPTVGDMVRIPDWLLDKLSKRRRRGRPKKDSVCANEISTTEHKNTWLLSNNSGTTEHKNTMATFSEVKVATNFREVLPKKYMATFEERDAVCANEIENRINPLRGLLPACACTRVRARVKLNLNLSNLLKCSELARGFFSFKKEKNALRAISFVQTEFEPQPEQLSLFGEPELSPFAQTRLEPSPPPPTRSISFQSEGATGSKLGSSACDSTWLYEGVPPYPTTRLVPPIELPSPPMIDPNWTEDEQLAFFARVWTSTIEHKTGHPCWMLRTRRQGKGKKQKLVNGIDRHRDELLQAIALCNEHKLQPAPWIAFSYDEWVNALSKAERTEIEKNTKTKSRRRKRRKASSAPPIKWVFAESRVEARQGWYGHVLERELYRGIIRFTPSHKNLIRRHTAMRFALLALSSPTQREVDKIVDRFLPERYELLVRQCKADTAREQERLNRRAREGEWLWP